MLTSKVQARLAQRLEPCSGDDSGFEAREIIREMTGSVSPFAEISEEQYRKCIDMVRRRESGKPLQYIFGHWEFYGNDFSVGEGVLIPRPETELLCDMAVSHLKKTGGVFVDLCSGSGCIAIAVAKHTGLKAGAVELSDKAFAYLSRNIEKNNVSQLITAINGDIFDSAVISRFADGSLSAILSNPPYISEKDMKALQKEVRFEPETALYGGTDGLDYYRRIFADWKAKLMPGGLFAVEIGDEQGEAVAELMVQCGLSPVITKDYSGNDRIVSAII